MKVDYIQTRFHPWKKIGLFLLALGAWLPGLAVDSIQEVLVLGPLPAKNWTAISGTHHQAESLENMMRTLAQAGLPVAEATQSIFGMDHRWQVRQTATAIESSVPAGSAWVFSFNMETVRFSKGELVFSWPGKVHLFQNQTSIAAKENGDGETRFSIKVTTGSHHFFALVSGDPGDLSIQWQPELDATTVVFHLEPQARVNAKQLFFTPTVNQIHLSPDGKWIAQQIRGWDEQQEKWVIQFEIRDYKNGKQSHAWTHRVPSQFHWRPDSSGFAFQIDHEIWVQNLDDGRAKKSLAGVKSTSILGWHPSGHSLLVGLDQKGEQDPEGVKRYRSLEDRWAGWRDIEQIGQLDLQSGILQTWTQEPFGASFEDIDEAGNFLLYTTSPPKYDKPPHRTTVLKRLDLNTGEQEVLREFASFANARFTQGGYYISAGPTAFDRVGTSLPPQTPVNDFDTQLFFWDGVQAKAEPLTKYFDPSIVGFEPLSNGDLMLLVIEKDERSLVQYQRERKNFRFMNSGVEIVERFDVAKTKKPRLVLTGTSSTSPQQVLTMNWGDPAKPWGDVTAGEFSQTYFGEVKPWHFTNEDGFEIMGRYYTPPGFSPKNRYPLIVYYYGGTVPVNRQFTGRYPFNLWAAHGYIIYVLQPSGTIGQGQSFSALHVNAWGKKTAADIITGTGQFIRAHDFINENKVGCIGASYGGFMTMHLITKTPFFRAAISHAGISDLSGYWGEGWWGFAYSGIASRGSFPWNQPEFYTQVSPLFQADSISTPLLLLHGDADTNVPPGQSHNMYTALKLLNKQVELITFDGENHHILDPKKRLIWWDTILAWFDKQLKDQSQWWEDLYPN